MKLKFTRRAVRDVEEIAEYVGAHNPAAVKGVRSALLRTLQNIVSFPGIGRPQTTEGVRKFVVPKRPYLIYYCVDDMADEVIVITIQHAKQNRVFSDG
jgi:toxin ParE1/3/4